MGRSSGMKASHLRILIVGLMNLPSLLVSSSSSSLYNVVDYGAAGDGSTEDTTAFLDAWKATCESSSDSSPTMVVPSDMTFLILPVVFNGPCRSQQIKVQISGEIIAPQQPSDWKCKDGYCPSWILFRNITGIRFFGGGKIHGQGKNWWKIEGPYKPAAMKIEESKKIHVTNLNFIDNPRMHLFFNNTETVNVEDITIIAPERSPNTDGIHVLGSTHVIIQNCNIGTGDDCISIITGSSHVTVTNISCGPGHGVSIGSLGKYGAYDTIEDIQIRDVVFTNTQNGVRIKSWQGGRGYARNILFEGIVSKGAQNPIIIDQFYCDHEDCRIQEAAVQIKGVTFRNISGTSREEMAIKIACSETVPCRNIVAEDIFILSGDGKESTIATCSNVNGAARGLQVPKLPCLAPATF